MSVQPNPQRTGSGQLNQLKLEVMLGHVFFPPFPPLPASYSTPQQKYSILIISLLETCLYKA